MKKGNIYQEAIKKWGINFQLDVLVEECGELIHSVMKFRREKSLGNFIHFVEEIVDVEIMINQIKTMLSTSVYEEIKKEKINRLKELLKNKRKEKGEDNE